MPLVAYATHEEEPRTAAPDPLHRNPVDTHIRLSPQEIVFVEAGVKLLKPLSRWIWQHWGHREVLPASGELSEPLSFGPALIARAALAALGMKVSERLDHANLDEDEEHHLMNDLSAIQDAEDYLARVVPDVTRFAFGSLSRR
jgi:hypothetical protein